MQEEISYNQERSIIPRRSRKGHMEPGTELKSGIPLFSRQTLNNVDSPMMPLLIFLWWWLRKCVISQAL